MYSIVSSVNAPSSLCNVVDALPMCSGLSFLIHSLQSFLKCVEYEARYSLGYRQIICMNCPLRVIYECLDHCICNLKRRLLFYLASVNIPKFTSGATHVSKVFIRQVSCCILGLTYGPICDERMRYFGMNFQVSWIQYWAWNHRWIYLYYPSRMYLSHPYSTYSD